MDILSLSLGLLICGFALLLLYFALIFFANQSLAKEQRNSFLNSYPYQFYLTMAKPYRVLLYTVLVLSASALMAGETLFFAHAKTLYQLILSVTFPLSLLFLAFGNLLPLSFYKPHIFLTMLGFALFAFSGSLTSFLTIVPGAIFYPNSVSLVILILIGVLGFLGLVLLFNPKLLNWAKMDKMEVDGVSYYVKPKLNALAFYEWLYLGFEGLTGLLLFINILLTRA